MPLIRRPVLSLLGKGKPAKMGKVLPRRIKARKMNRAKLRTRVKVKPKPKSVLRSRVVKKKRAPQKSRKRQ